MYNVLSLIVGICYVIMGVFIAYKKFFVVELDGVIPYLLGGILIAYGVFRVVRAIIFIRRKDEDD